MIRLGKMEQFNYNLTRYSMQHSIYTTLILLITLFFLTSSMYSEVNIQKDSKSKTQNLSKKFVTRVCTQNESQEVDDFHNRLRSEVGCEKISYSDKLALVALEWCQELGRKNGAFEHRPQTGSFARMYGENIYMGTKSSTPFLDAMQLWATEKSKFRNVVLNQSNWMKAGHYSQMIWNKSIKVGCAVVEINGNCIVVCNYDPTGNMLGEKTF